MASGLAPSASSAFYSGDSRWNMGASNIQCCRCKIAPTTWNKMETTATDCSVAAGDGPEEVSCLMRVGRNSDWLRFYENSEVQYANAG